MNTFRRFSQISDASVIEEVLMKDIGLNIYLLGDLDSFFYPHTSWFAGYENDSVECIAMLYEGPGISTVLTSAASDTGFLAETVENFAGMLPEIFYAHFACGLMNRLKNFRVNRDLGIHYRMILTDQSKVLQEADGEIRRLGSDDMPLITEFYSENYPDNFFDRRMLLTGKYFGSFSEHELTGIAGIHVYSPDKKVAALGNIAVSVMHRGRGLCASLTRRLCKDLLENVQTIGLNVHAENKHAIKCYEQCGFEIAGSYEEFEIINESKEE